MLNGELVWISDWAHGMSDWARLCKLQELVNLVLNIELVWVSDWAHGMSGWAHGMSGWARLCKL